MSSKGNFGSFKRRALPVACGCLFGAALLAAVPAFAQDTTEAATQGLSCAQDRIQQTLNCTANEYVVTATSQSNTITACHFGDQITVDIDVGITSSSADRYNIGYFVGENGNAPNVAGGTCSVATFPFTPTGVNTSGGQWYDAGGGNACGDYNKNSTTTNLITGVKVKCQAGPDGNLSIPFVVTYAQNSGDACTGPTDVAPGSPSKCDANVVPVTNVVVQFNADPTCSKTAVFDNTSNTVTSTITISNLGPDSADNTSFDDPMPADVTSVTSANCQNAQNGAACPVGPLTITGTDVSGTIPTLPAGGSVDIVVVASTTPGSTNQFVNTATVTANPGVVIDQNTQNNSCSNEAFSLPVHLQSFDVN